MRRRKRLSQRNGRILSHELVGRQLHDLPYHIPGEGMISYIGARISAIKGSRREFAYDANPNGIAGGVHRVDLEWPWRGTALDGAELPPARFRHAAAVVLPPRSISHLTPRTIFWISPPFLCPSLSHPHSHFLASVSLQSARVHVRAPIRRWSYDCTPCFHT